MANGKRGKVAFVQYTPTGKEIKVNTPKTRRTARRNSKPK